MTSKRQFLPYFILTAVTLCFGLLSRSQYVSLPSFISTYAGDTLWALMVFFGFCLIVRQKKTWGVALFAILFSFAIELSQLYQAPWINSIRHTKPCGLILGYGFKWSDLVCYSTGVLIGILIDLLLRQKLKE